MGAGPDVRAHLSSMPGESLVDYRKTTFECFVTSVNVAVDALEYLLLKVRDGPKPFGPKSAGRRSFEQGRLGSVFLLDGPHTG